MNDVATLSLPALSHGPGFMRYLDEVKRIASLEPEEEYMLAKRYAEHQDLDAAHKLAASHLKLVVKIAFGYRNYGLPLMELVSEGNIGLLQAVRKFNPELGHRLSTYAMWWIRASIQEYVVRSWSLVKVGTTAAQKKLFFNLRKMRNRIQALEGRPFHADDLKKIAKDLNVTENEAKEMNLRMAGADISLNRLVAEDSDDEVIDLVPETRPNQETVIGEWQNAQYRRSLFHMAMENLSERERHILTGRRLSEPAVTLEELSQFHKLSRERVRQIEEAVVAKLAKMVASYQQQPLQLEAQA
jgi:RNA polymerase sigma-32 factor